MPPVAPYPASLTDINYAVRWLKARAVELRTKGWDLPVSFKVGVAYDVISSAESRSSQYAAPSVFGMISEKTRMARVRTAGPRLRGRPAA